MCLRLHDKQIICFKNKVNQSVKTVQFATIDIHFFLFSQRPRSRNGWLRSTASTTKSFQTPSTVRVTFFQHKDDVVRVAWHVNSKLSPQRINRGRPNCTAVAIQEGDWNHNVNDARGRQMFEDVDRVFISNFESVHGTGCELTIVAVSPCILKTLSDMMSALSLLTNPLLMELRLALQPSKVSPKQNSSLTSCIILCLNSLTMS